MSQESLGTFKRRNYGLPHYLPVITGDKTGDNGDFMSWSAILPVPKWLVAKHPFPLQVDVVVNPSVGVKDIGCVVGVHTLGLALICVAITLAIAWNQCFIDPFGIGRKCLSKSDAIRIRGNSCSSLDILFQKLAS